MSHPKSAPTLAACFKRYLTVRQYGAYLAAQIAASKAKQ